MNLALRLVSVLLSSSVVPAAILAEQAAPSRAPQPAAPRAITIDDAFRIREVKEPQLSPDAKWLAYTVTTASLKDDDNKSRIWMLPILPAGAAIADPIPLTAEDASSTHPRWSPDGKFVAFLSARHDGKTQVWLLNRLGGEAEKLTETAQDVEDFIWSPDSRFIALVLRDPSPEELEAAGEKARGAANNDEDAEKEEGEGAKDKKRRPTNPGLSTAYSSRKTFTATSTAAARTSTSSTSPPKLSRKSPAAISTTMKRSGPPTASTWPSPATVPFPSRMPPTTRTSGWWPPTTPTRART